MSLLMEALRKAEAAKRAGQDAASPEADTFTSATVEPETPRESLQAAPEVFKFTSSDDLLALIPREDELVEAPAPIATPASTVRQSESQLNDDVLDDYLTTITDPELDEMHAPTERERVKVQDLRGRAGAASMFEAKVPQDNIKSKQRQRMQILGAALAVAVLIVGGTGWYLTTMTGTSGVGVNQSVANYNLQKRGFLGETPANSTGQAVTPAVTATAAAAPATVAAQTIQTAPAPTATKPAEVALAVSDPRPGGSSPVVAEPGVAPPNSTAATVDQNNLFANAPAVSASTTGGNIMEISRSNTTAKVQPALQSAYNQLQKGNLSAANDLYQELVTRYPNNQDALLGLADVQLKLGNQGGARITYTHLLKLNPLDGRARTGMLQAIPSADPAAYENELLALRQQFPTLAPLSFALGNHYAKNSRWHEAQSAYFDALLQARRENKEGVSPDYAFNLAVSLEQLGQKRTALEYYKQAESLAITVKPGFDPMMLRQRLSALEQQR